MEACLPPRGPAVAGDEIPPLHLCVPEARTLATWTTHLVRVGMSTFTVICALYEAVLRLVLRRGAPPWAASSTGPTGGAAEPLEHQEEIRAHSSLRLDGGAESLRIAGSARWLMCTGRSRTGMLHLDPAAYNNGSFSLLALPAGLRWSPSSSLSSKHDGPPPFPSRRSRRRSLPACSRTASRRASPACSPTSSPQGVLALADR